MIQLFLTIWFSACAGFILGAFWATGRQPEPKPENLAHTGYKEADGDDDAPLGI